MFVYKRTNVGNAQKIAQREKFAVIFGLYPVNEPHSPCCAQGSIFATKKRQDKRKSGVRTALEG